ncbi:hypothetical protein [Salegentibacter sp. F14]
MKIFEERQSFNQWWIILLLGVVFLLVLIPVFGAENTFSAQESIIGSVFALALVMLVGLLIFSLRLNTRIDSSGIWVYWKPFTFLHRQYSWQEINQCYVRTYKPIQEYGGWGLRGVGRNKAWNISGNSGIQIVEKSGKKFLIGTQQPEKARQIINRFFNHKTNEQ